MPAAETDVRAALGQRNMTERFAARREHAHAVEFVGAHAPAAPQIAVDIDAKTIGRAAWARIDQHAVVRERAAVLDDVEGANRARRAPRPTDIEHRFVGRECETVRTNHLVVDERHSGGLPVDPIYALRHFGFLLFAFIETVDAEARIGEPDRAV